MTEKQKDCGYGIIMRAAMRSQIITCGAKAVYAYLCSFSGHDGICFPSQWLIAKELNLHANTLRKYLRELEDNNFIRTHKERTENGKFTRMTYEINYNHAQFTVDGSAVDGSADDGSAVNRYFSTNNNKYNNNKYNNNNFNNNNFNNITDMGMQRTSKEDCKLIEEQFMANYMKEDEE